MCRPLGKITIFWPNDVFLIIFLLGRSNCLQITKNSFLRFLAFYPVIRHFRRSSVSHGSRFDEIYCFVSSILHFMPSGSISENLSKIYRKSIENLSKIYRESIENLSKIYRESIEHLSKTYRTSIDLGATLGSLWSHFGVRHLGASRLGG